MTFLFIVLFGALLQSPVARAKAYNVDFRRFCDLYGELLNVPSSPSSSNGPALYESLNKIKQEIRRIAKDLVSNQGLPGDFHLKKHCAQPPNYLKAECLFYKRRIIADTNGDWNFFLPRWRNRYLLRPYVKIWLLHPQMIGCARELNQPQETNDAKAKILDGLAGAKAGYFAMFFKNKYEKSTLGKEIEQSCGTDNEDPIFCPGLIEMIRLADMYEQVKDKNKKGRLWNAYLLRIGLIKRSHQQFNSASLSEEMITGVIVKTMEEFLKHTSYRQKAEIKYLLALMPEKPRRISCEDFSSIQSSSRKIDCIFWKAMDLIHTYVESSAPMKYGNGTVILNTYINYPEFLKLTQISEILSVAQNQNNELTNLAGWVTREVKKDVNNRFKGLRTYFQTVATFNKNKANADIKFIKGRLDEYQKDVTTLKEELSQDLSKIIHFAFKAVGAEIVEDIILVGLALYSAFNPLKQILGSGDLGSVMDRTAKLANSFADHSQLESASQTFNKIRIKTNELAKKFQKNDKFLENVNILIKGVDENNPMEEFKTQKKSFLKNYENYNPQAKRPELTAMTATYENLVDACCDVIERQQSTLAVDFKRQARDKCQKAKEVAEKMFETFAEIYDFQFDLIEAMADYMRATNAYNGAIGIAEDYDTLVNGQDQDTVSELKTMSIFSFISYKINIWDISDAYCHILTYKEGGYTPSVCLQRERDIAGLASYSSPFLCRSTETYSDVPVRSKSDKGYMDLSDLYAGKDITFKIPSSHWLVDNRWISARDKDAVILIKKFEVFLPTNSKFQRKVRIQAKNDGDNKISVLDNIQYVIVPNSELVFEYSEGYGSEQSCRQASHVFNNPYGAKLPKMCRITIDDCQEQLKETVLFPSVYSRWKISVDGYQAAPIPKPANKDFKLKVGVRLCILGTRSNDQGIAAEEEKVNQAKKDESKPKVQERPSCSKLQYWSIRSGRCVNCPDGSKPELDGYLCLKIPNKMGQANHRRQQPMKLD